MTVFLNNLDLSIHLIEYLLLLILSGILTIEYFKTAKIHSQINHLKVIKYLLFISLSLIFLTMVHNTKELFFIENQFINYAIIILLLALLFLLKRVKSKLNPSIFWTTMTFYFLAILSSFQNHLHSFFIIATLAFSLIATLGFYTLVLHFLLITKQKSKA